MANQPIPGQGMKDGSRTPIEPGLLDRVVQGVKLVLTGKNDWFGPGDPVPAQQTNNEDVRGRAFDFPVGANQRRLPRDGEGVTFAHMRTLADGWDLLRLVIETRKDQMESLNWNIGLRPEVEKRKKEEARVEQAKKHVETVKAKNEKRKTPPELHPDGTPMQPEQDIPDVPEVPKEDPRIEHLRAFFQFPDGEHEWKTWLRALLEDQMVIDAATIYPRPTVGGGLHSLELVDGGTIKRVLDQTGRTPEPPLVAYQQVLKGVPAVDYNRDELIYRPRNVRTNRVYGFSPVEQIIMTINIAMRRQLSQLQYYTEGNIPEAIAGVPDTWTPEHIRQFQEYWDTLVEGNTAQRRHMKFVPGGMEVQPMREPELKGEYDEWLARVVCYAFSLNPQAFVKQMNRATADTAQDTALKEGLLPLMNWTKSLCDYVIWKFFGFTDLEFRWEEEQEASPETQMKVLTGYKAAGIMTDDECREELGKPPLSPEQKEALKPPPVPGFGPPGNGPPKPGQPPQPAEGGAGKPMGKLLGSGLLKAKRISRHRASVAASTSDFTGLVAPALAALGKRVAKELAGARKAIRADATVQALLVDLTFEELEMVRPDIAEILRDMAEDGGKEALAQVVAEVTKDQLEQVNAKAKEWADEHAAELVTAIQDSTRDMIRASVAQALEEGASNDELADTLQDSYAFSDERAETIARTETAYADIQGNLEGYRVSGVVSGKQWIIAQDEECDDCAALDGVVVGLDEQFPNDGGDGPPLHPNCRCDILPVLTEEE